MSVTVTLVRTGVLLETLLVRTGVLLETLLLRTVDVWLETLWCQSRWNVKLAQTDRWIDE